MMHFNWKRKNSFVAEYEHQIRGIIAVSVSLAFIPLLIYHLTAQNDRNGPVLSIDDPGKVAVELAVENGVSGIYFVERGTSVGQFLSGLGCERTVKDTQLQNGSKIRVFFEEARKKIAVEKMEAAPRLALGLPLDINTASEDELQLIPGIGAKMAGNIVVWRKKNGRFGKLDQMMEIKGIKEKKLSKLSPYLYVDQSVH